MSIKILHFKYIFLSKYLYFPLNDNDKFKLILQLKIIAFIQKIIIKTNLFCEKRWLQDQFPGIHQVDHASTIQIASVGPLQNFKNMNNNI